REDQRPGLAAVARAIDAAVAAVAPQFAGRAGIDDLGILRMHDDARDPLRFRQSHVGPGFAAVGRFVDTVADRDGIARPALAGADPDGPRIRRIDGDRADRLNGLLVEDRLEARAAVGALPHAAARRADVDGRLAVDVARGHRGDAAAH